MSLYKIIITLVFITIANNYCAQNKDVFGNPIYDFTVNNCFIDSLYKPSVTSKKVKSNKILKSTTYWRTISFEALEVETPKKKFKGCEQVSFFEIIKFGILEKNLKAFVSDDFSEAPKGFLSKEDFKKNLIYCDTVFESYFDEQGLEAKKTSIKKGYLSGNEVKSFLLKEDWYLDSYSGKLNKKIIGIAPLMVNKVSKKVLPICWIYFDEWLNFFKQFKTKNYLGDNGLTFYDALVDGVFKSKISKESNLKEVKVKNDRRGNQSLIESEFIKEKVRNSESDLFQY